LLDEASEQATMHHESERLYTALLNSISHELRTPIATIKGASSSLLDPAMQHNPHAQTELAGDIQQSADRLNRLVENLLDMSRLESGKLSLKREWCDLADIIGVAVKRLDECDSRHLDIQIPPNVPLIYVDFGLFEQILVNLLDNACRYTPSDKPIIVNAKMRHQLLEIAVIDGGEGIPDDLLDRIFDKFYRLPGSRTGGTGLGLSISRGLAQAHQATLKAENMPNGGAKFTLSLPMTEKPPQIKEVNHE
jgi:two-component system, OmpR family, sensor histidine kinase KdpD